MNESDSPFKPYERIGTTGGVPGSVGPKRRLRRGARFVVLGVCALVLGLIWWSGDPQASTPAKPVQAADTNRSTLLDVPQRRTPTPAVQPTQGTLPVAVAETPPVKVDPPKRTHAGLSAAVEGSVAKWMAEANKKSKGKVVASNTIVSVHVRRVNGEVLVDRNTAAPVRPASNLKLLTCMAAAVLCGDKANFETQFERMGRIEAGVLKGDLVARAGADPLYDVEGDGGVERWAKSLADQLKQAGIQRIEGALVLDEGTYLEPGPAPEWPDANEYWKEYCALSGGFSANAGCLSAHIKPGQVGGAGAVQVLPAGHGLTRKGSVKTTSKGDVIIAVEARGSHLIVRGSVPKNSSGYHPRFSYPDPVELFGHSMLQGLKEQGVEVLGGFKRQRNVPAGQPVALLQSPVIDTFLPILRDSNNSVADQLFLYLGQRFAGKGDRASGAAAILSAMEVLMVDRDGIRIVDGSGLSKANEIRADQVTGVIAGLLNRGTPAAQIFWDSLPVAGKSGSLSRRMRSGPATGRVHAKTGFVNGTSALSGVVQTQDGERLVFSILVAYPHQSGMNTKIFKPMQDEICAKLVEFQDRSQ